ncbi:hypothetical protein Tco_1231106 [Tanacetum coccineum]
MIYHYWVEKNFCRLYAKWGKSSRNKKRATENLNLFYQDIGTYSSTRIHLIQEEATKEALALRISQKFALLEEARPILKTIGYHDKYKKVLDKIWKDKVELDGMIVKEEEEAIKKVKGEALKEKDNPEAFIFPIKLEGQVEAMGILTNVLCQVGVTTLIAKFLILDIPIDRDAPMVVGRGFLRTIGGIVNTPERLFSTFDRFCHQTFRAARSDVLRNPKTKRSLAIQTVTNPFWKINVWKKAVSFVGSLPVPLKHVNWKPDYKGCYTKEEEATGQWRTEMRVTDPYGNIYIQGFTTKKIDQKLSKYHKLNYGRNFAEVDHRELPIALDNLKPWRRYYFHKFIMISYYGKVATMRRSLVYADDELQSKKIIKFRLGGRAHNLTLLEFARRLGLYHADELEEDGFDVYFQGGLHSDDNFNA